MRTKLVVVVNDLYPYGAQRVALATMQGLAAKFDEVVGVSLEGGNIGDLSPATTVRFVSLNRSRGGVGGFLELIRKFRGLILREQPTHILSHMMFANLVAIAASLTRRKSRRVRLVTVDHSPPSKSLIFERSPRSLLRLAKWLYPKASLSIGVSDAVVLDVVNSFELDSSKCIRIYNPVDVDAVRREADSPPPHPWLAGEKGVPALVCVGGFRPVKQQEVLIEAMTLLNDCRLILVGDGARRSLLERFALDLGVSGRVVFVGFCAEPAAYMKFADAVVVPSRWEGFGLVAVEAAAVGTPVVASASAGLTELIPKFVPGRLVECGDVASLARGIHKVLDARGPAPIADLVDFYPQVVVGQYADALLSN